MRNTTGLYPRVQVDTTACAATGQAGGVLLVETIRTSGPDAEMSTALRRWRKPLAVHDPGKIVLDLAVALAVGGDCLADVTCSAPNRASTVGSRRIRRCRGWSTPSPTTWTRALSAIEAARAAARARVWALAGDHAPDHGRSAATPLIIDLDATLVTSHSDKEQARPTFKRGYGFHPLCAFVEHGAIGTGEPLQVMLRPGNAGSNTAADHIVVTRKALAQLPGHQPGVRPGKTVLIRTDAAGATHAFLDWLTQRRLSYSIGFTLGDITDVLARIPEQVWTPAYTCDHQVREGAC